MKMLYPIPIEQVLEEMYRRYERLEPSAISEASFEAEVFVEGFITAQMKTEKGLMFNFSQQKDSEVGDVSVIYTPRIGISENKLYELCHILKNYKLITKIYGEVTPVCPGSNFRTIQLHGIEFKIGDKTKKYPNKDLIEGSEQRDPIPYINMDHWDIEVLTKEFHRLNGILDILNKKLDSEQKERLETLLGYFDKPKSIHGQNIRTFVEGYLSGIITKEGYEKFKNDINKDFAEFEFYKIFEHTHYELERKMKYSAPQISIEGGLDAELENHTKVL